MTGYVSQYSFLVINHELFEFQQTRMPLSEGSGPVDAYLSLVMAFLMAGGSVTSRNAALDRPKTWFHGKWEVAHERRASVNPNQHEFTREDWQEIAAALREWGVALPEKVAGPVIMESK